MPDGYSTTAPVWILSYEARDMGGYVLGAFDTPDAAMKYFQVTRPDLRHWDWVQADREYADAPKIYNAISENGLDIFSIQEFVVLSDEEIG